MEMTYKQFWIKAYLALLQNNEPEVAVLKADTALLLCNDRWKSPVVEGSVRLVADKLVATADFSLPSKLRD